MVPTLKRVAGSDKVIEAPRVTGAEDFSFFARQVPGLFFFVGVTAPDTPPFKAAPNHSPRFRIHEAGLIVGLRSILHVTFDYLSGAGQ
jgi:amidohydrolase